MARLMTAFHVGGCACMALMAAALAATGSGRLTSPGLLSALSGCLRAITSCFHPAQPGFISPAPRRSQAPCRFVSSPGNARTGARATRTHLAAPVHPAAIRESRRCGSGTQRRPLAAHQPCLLVMIGVRAGHQAARSDAVAFGEFADIT